MNTTRAFLLGALCSALWISPAAAGPNDLPPGKAVAKPRAADGTLGMAIMSAVVNADGTLARGAGVISAVKSTGFGSYIIEFDRSVVNCTYTANLGLSGSSGTSAPGYATVAGGSSSPKAVFLQTFTKDGDLSDRAHHLIVFCSR